MRSQSSSPFPGFLAGASLLAAASLLAGGLIGPDPAVAAQQGEPPRVVPLPQPEGPRIRRVTHDAVRPVHAGAKVAINVLAEPRMTVTAFIGSVQRDISCASTKEDPAAYACEAVVPERAAGTHRVRAQVTDARGRTSSLSAPLPLVVERLNPWREVNTLNVRIAPVYFSAGSGDLDETARAALAKDSDLLKAHPEYGIVLEGHAGSDEGGDLQDLSRRRAEAVRDHLASFGIPPERMRVEPLADTRPMVNPKDPRADRSLDRLVMVLFEPAGLRRGR